MTRRSIGFEEQYYRDHTEKRLQESKTSSVMVQQTSLQALLESELAKEASTFLEDTKIRFSPPEREVFELFYKELNFFNVFSSELKDGRLMMWTQTRMISIDVRAIVELLAQAMHTRIKIPSKLKVESPPPFIENMDAIIQHRITWMLVEFQKIFDINDPRIQKLCQDYFFAMAYPLAVRLAYSEWENRQITYKIEQETKQIEARLVADYRIKSKEREEEANEKVIAAKTAESKAQAELSARMTQLEMLNRRYNNQKMDLDTKKGAVEESYRKRKDLEKQVRELEKQILELKQETKTLQAKIPAKKGESEYVRDMTSTKVRPVWRSKTRNEVIALPAPLDEFKKDYKLIGQEGDECIYDKDGFEYRLPVALADELAQEDESQDNKEKTGQVNELVRAKYETACKDKPQLAKIYQIIVNSGDNGTTQSEISGEADVDSRKIKGKYLSILLELGLINEVRDGHGYRYTASAQRI